MTDTAGDFGQVLNLRVRQGCDFDTVEVTYTDAGSPVDITGCTLEGAVADANNDNIATVALTATDAAAGKFTIAITHTESAKLIARDKSSQSTVYQWQARLTDASSNVKPLFYGSITVQRNLIQ